jgi:hypothetical protein
VLGLIESTLLLERLVVGQNSGRFLDASLHFFNVLVSHFGTFLIGMVDGLDQSRMSRKRSALGRATLLPGQADTGQTGGFII